LIAQSDTFDEWEIQKRFRYQAEAACVSVIMRSVMFYPSNRDARRPRLVALEASITFLHEAVTEPVSGN
jgi:hypothetical protein